MQTNRERRQSDKKDIYIPSTAGFQLNGATKGTRMESLDKAQYAKTVFLCSLNVRWSTREPDQDCLLKYVASMRTTTSLRTSC